MQPDRNNWRNLPEVSIFLRQNMDMVYQDRDSMVLLRDANHRPAFLRHRDEQALRKAEADYLP